MCFLISISASYSQDSIISGLTLKNAVEIGLKNSILIQNARENQSVNKGAYLQNNSLARPEIKYDNQWIPIGNEKTISISQSIEFPLAYLYRNDRFDIQSQIDEISIEKTKLQISSNIKTNYYNVLYYKKILSNAIYNTELTEYLYLKTKERQNVGDSPAFETDFSNVQLAEARKKIEIGKLLLEKSKRELLFSMGFTEYSEFKDFIILDSLAYIALDLRDTLNKDKWLNNNPEFKIANAVVEIASINQKIATTSYLPNFSLSYLIQNRDNQNLHGISIGISAPLWFMLEQKGKSIEADAQKNICENNLLLTQNEKLFRLNSLLSEMDAYKQQIELYQSSLIPKQEQLLNISKQSYESGQISNIEFVQARQIMINSMDTYYELIRNYYQTIFRIEETSGKSFLN
jgi:outer membrane protein TolC